MADARNAARRIVFTGAAGGIGTYPDVADLPKCFEPGKEILVYKNAADLARQFDALRLDPARAAAMIEAGHARTLRDHTFSQRAQTILNDWLPSSSFRI